MLVVRRFSDRSRSAKKEKARFVTLEASESDDYATGLKKELINEHTTLPEF